MTANGSITCSPPADALAPATPRQSRFAVLRGLALFLAGLLVGGAGMFFWTRPTEDGLPPRHWEATVYLPLADNDGKAFTEQDWNDALGVLVAECGGATLGTQHEGVWVDGRKHTRREAVRAVVISFPRDRLDNFRRALAEAGRRLRQEAVYVRLDEPRVEVLTVPAKKEK
jgi:hypothetical protein